VTNNDVLRRIRYTFDLKDKKVVDIFALTKAKVTSEQVNFWLRKDDDQAMVELADVDLASFLNGFIIEKRGKRDGDLPKPEKELTKNVILMKIKIALNLQADDIIALLENNGLTVGKAELSAFFRKPEHKNYRQCKAQFLRNFLQGVQDKYRIAPAPKKYIKPAEKNNSEPNHNKQASYNSSSNNSENKKSYKKPNGKKAVTKAIYVNPNATKVEKTSKRTTLKLKPEDIYKNS